MLCLCEYDCAQTCLWFCLSSYPVCFRVQVAVKVPMTEKVDLSTPSGDKSQVIQHEPCWVFTMKYPPTIMNRYGGWRVSARLRDRFAPSGVGAEVKDQLPTELMREKFEGSWEMQKTAMKSNRWSLSGMVANALLR